MMLRVVLLTLLFVAFPSSGDQLQDLKAAILDGKVESLKALVSGPSKPSKEILNQSLLIVSRVKHQTTNQKAHSSSAEIATLLIHAGADPNYEPSKGESRGRALLEAVYSSNRPVVEVLLKAGADPKKALNSNGGSLLALSIQQEDPEIVKLLWPSYQPMTDELNKEITLIAGSYGKPQSVAVLSTLGFRLKKDSKEALEALYRAVDKGEVANVEEILKQGVDPNQMVYSTNLLASAVQKKNLPVITALIAHGAQVNTPVTPQEYPTPMSAAVNSGDVEIFKFLVKKGGKLAPVAGQTSLIHSLPWYTYEREPKKREDFVNGVLEILAQLIKAGNKVDALDRQEQTLLARIAGQGNPELILKLIEYGADVNYTPKSCKPSKVVESSGPKSVKANSMKRVAISEEQIMGFICLPPLSTAINFNNIENVQIFLKHKVKVNLASAHDGTTPLMAAARVGNPALVELLLKNGANPSLKDVSGQTASAIAGQNDNTRAKSLIDQKK